MSEKIEKKEDDDYKKLYENPKSVFDKGFMDNQKKNSNVQYESFLKPYEFTQMNSQKDNSDLWNSPPPYFNQMVNMQQQGSFPNQGFNPQYKGFQQQQMAYGQQYQIPIPQQGYNKNELPEFLQNMYDDCPEYLKGGGFPSSFY